MNLPIWIPKTHTQELTREQCRLLDLPTWARYKALFGEWFNNRVILYAWEIDNEDDDNDSGLLCATGKCCC